MAEPRAGGHRAAARRRRPDGGGAAGLVWRRSRSGPVALLAAGLLLVAWIVVQLLFIRTLSWLQPVCFGYGLVVAWLGSTSRRWS